VFSFQHAPLRTSCHIPLPCKLLQGHLPSRFRYLGILQYRLAQSGNVVSKPASLSQMQFWE
jgi:hypothetical protein